MLREGNYHVLISISNQALMNMYSDLFFFPSVHVSVVISTRKKTFLSRFILPQSHPVTASLRQTNQLCFLPAVYQVILPLIALLSSHTGHFRQTARRANLFFCSQSILKGLHCKAKEVLKEDTNRLISLQLVNDPRKLKTVCLKNID